MQRPCPAEAPAPPVVPDVRPEHRVAAYWLARQPEADAILLTPEQIAAHNRRVSELQDANGWGSGRWDPLALEVQPERVRRRLEQRATKLREAVEQGKRVLASGERPVALLERLREPAVPLDEVRVVRQSSALRCYPTAEGLYEKAWDLSFDLMQCAQLRYGEPVRVLASLDDYLFVASSYAVGWVERSALSRPLAAEDAARYVHPARFVVVQADALPLFADAAGQEVLGVGELGLKLPLLEQGDGRVKVLAPGAGGLVEGWVLAPRAVSVGYPPLTRRAFLGRAFALQDTPYGWGGSGAKRDCSRMMMDLLAAFGVLLPRNSWNQSQAGTATVEVEELDEAAKAEAIERAGRAGIVLLYLPGHIMLYLGRDGDHLYALHQFSGYLVPCPGGGETMNRVNSTIVTTLELGRGSSRRAFIERITRLVLFGPSGQTPPRDG